MKKNKSYIHSINNLYYYVKIKNQIHKFASKIYLILEKYIFNKTNKPIIIILFVFVLLENIISNVASSPSNDVVYFGLTLFLLLITILYKYQSRYIYILCLILLGIMYILFLFQGTSPQTENVAVWIVLFMLVGIGKQWFENEKK